MGHPNNQTSKANEMDDWLTDRFGSYNIYLHFLN